MSNKHLASPFSIVGCGLYFDTKEVSFENANLGPSFLVKTTLF